MTAMWTYDITTTCVDMASRTRARHLLFNISFRILFSDVESELDNQMKSPILVVIQNWTAGNANLNPQIINNLPPRLQVPFAPQGLLTQALSGASHVGPDQPVAQSHLNLATGK